VPWREGHLQLAELMKLGFPAPHASLDGAGTFASLALLIRSGFAKGRSAKPPVRLSRCQLCVVALCEPRRYAVALGRTEQARLQKAAFSRVMRQLHEDPSMAAL
jgi:hypothetical protein